MQLRSNMELVAPCFQPKDFFALSISSDVIFTDQATVYYVGLTPADKNRKININFDIIFVFQAKGA